MLTDEQMTAARKALQETRTQKLIRKAKLHIYLQDIEKAERWCLPFRMVHDRQFIPNEEAPNDYYGRPLPMMYDRVSGCITRNPEAVPPITKEEAVYHFTRHLAAVDLDEYGRGDWTGRPTTQDEADRLKRMYQERQRDYIRNPGKYDTQCRPAQRTLFDEMTSP